MSRRSAPWLMACWHAAHRAHGVVVDIGMLAAARAVQRRGRAHAGACKAEKSVCSAVVSDDINQLCLCAQGITIADCSHPEMPLIYANEAFTRITGYSLDETLGKNCRFLQVCSHTSVCSCGRCEQALELHRAAAYGFHWRVKMLGLSADLWLVFFLWSSRVL